MTSGALFRSEDVHAGKNQDLETQEAREEVSSEQ
jgi:hypothetical protein